MLKIPTSYDGGMISVVKKILLFSLPILLPLLCLRRCGQLQLPILGRFNLPMLLLALVVGAMANIAEIANNRQEDAALAPT